MSIPHLGANLMKVVVPLLAIGVVFLALRIRRLPLAAAIGWVKPPPAAAAGWLLLYVAYILISNYFMFWRGPWDFTPWREAPLIIDILRVVGVAVLGPIAEELIFRGILYGRFAQTRLGVGGAIAITAISWGGIHYTYAPGVILLLVGAGLLLGLARWQTRSIVTPILMHITWNIYAVW